jgi:hypothetical protein
MTHVLYQEYILLIVFSLVPRPHPRGGKRVWWLWVKSLVQLTTRGGICASQSHRSFSSLTWLAYHRNVTVQLLATQIWIVYAVYAALLTNQIRVLFKCAWVGVRAQSQPNQAIGPKSPDPFPSFWGGVWGRDYIVIYPQIYHAWSPSSYTAWIKLANIPIWLHHQV